MRWISKLWLVLTLAALEPACTFYACPDKCGPDSNPTPQAGAGSSGQQPGSAGQATGGSSGAFVDNGTKPTGSWDNATGNLTELKSECGNMSYLSAKPDEDVLIAGIARNGLWSSDDGGDSWTALGQDPMDSMFFNRPSFILYDPKSTKTYWETGVYNGLGSFKTTDDGATFTALGTMHNDYISVDFADSKRRTVLISGHEADHLLHQSTDGGKTWNELGGDEPKDAGACSFPIVIDPETYLLGCRGWGDSKSGIYRSTDAGSSWELVSSAGGASTPLFASDGSIYFTSDAMGALARSEDQGQTWTLTGTVGALQPFVGPVELPDGRLAAISGQHVVVSKNQGQTWTAVSVDAPYVPIGLVYSKFQKAFYVWHFTCGETTTQVPDDGVLRYDFDYEN